MFEYIPLKKVTSVPIEATAFCRRPASNFLVLLQWDDAPEKTLEVRKCAKEIVDLVMEGQAKDLSGAGKLGYANYSTCFMGGCEWVAKDGTQPMTQSQKHQRPIRKVHLGPTIPGCRG